MPTNDEGFDVAVRRQIVKSELKSELDALPPLRFAKFAIVTRHQVHERENELNVQEERVHEQQLHERQTELQTIAQMQPVTNPTFGIAVPTAAILQQQATERRAEADALRGARQPNAVTGQDMPVLGYLHARASQNLFQVAQETIEGLSGGQRTQERVPQALFMGRGNVPRDVELSSGGSYVAQKCARRSHDVLMAGLGGILNRATAAAPPPFTRTDERLMACWSPGFTQNLAAHFPNPAMQTMAASLIAGAASAIYFGAGNCGEHSRIVLHLHTEVTDGSASVRMAANQGDHEWGEILRQAPHLDDEDIIPDGWTRSQAIIRSDSRFGSRPTQTVFQCESAAARQWMAREVNLMVARLRNDPIIDELTQATANTARQRFAEGRNTTVARVPSALSAGFIAGAIAGTVPRPSRGGIQPVVAPDLRTAIHAAGAARLKGATVSDATADGMIDAITAARDALLAANAPDGPGSQGQR
ncbi:hypothetical protein HLB44_15875 [Aquincola sp. S2]|uniref:Uncharacterized protein n=1 Tax=Pseudaquabacterium terrae TaxID=2732868 RepID=A0ABX2EIP3_9BURK|nr:hypothetical protein [Aquabacterium terrae]NRF68473.1 hypothetical protein [Aquabacterium terrae]